VRTGWYREVAVKGWDSQLVRSLLTSHAQLVRIGVDLANQVRGVLKPFGLAAGMGPGRPFVERVRNLVADSSLREVAEALLAAWQAINDQVSTLSRRLLAIARQDQTVQRLMSAPGVGVVVALAYVSVIDDPERFARSSSVGAYVGLTPRRFQSGEEDYTGRISRCGDAPAAWLLVRSRRHHPAPRREVVRREGLGHATAQTDGSKEGDDRRGAQALGHPPRHVA
jgi:transposase